MSLNWFKSSFSSHNGGCAQFAGIDPDGWQKADDSSGNSNSVELQQADGSEDLAAHVDNESFYHEMTRAAIARGEPLTLLRDSKNPEGAWLVFTRIEVAMLIAGMKAGEFDHLVATTPTDDDDDDTADDAPAPDSDDTKESQPEPAAG